MLYTERRGIFFEAALVLPLQMDSVEAGMHSVGWLPEGMDDHEAVRKVAQKVLIFLRCRIFSIQPFQRMGQLYGFGGFDQKEIHEGIDRLLFSWNSA